MKKLRNLPEKGAKTPEKGAKSPKKGGFHPQKGAKFSLRPREMLLFIFRLILGTF